MLLLTKTLFFMTFSRLSTILTTPFGQPLLQFLVLFAGLLFCRLIIIYKTMPSFIFKQATHPYGPPHGWTHGLLYMIISFYLSPICLYLLWFLICGCRDHINGINNFFLLLLHLKQSRKSQPPRLLILPEKMC